MKLLWEKDGTESVSVFIVILLVYCLLDIELQKMICSRSNAKTEKQ